MQIITSTCDFSAQWAIRALKRTITRTQRHLSPLHLYIGPLLYRIAGTNPPILPPEPPESETAPPIRSDVPRGLRLTGDDLKALESQTARHIAITLLLMLGLTFVTNVVMLVGLTVKNRLDAIPSFERMFAVWMPLLSGLVGSAETFYLTKEKK
jgi:hypothetical protein